MLAEINWTQFFAALGVLIGIVCVNFGNLITNWKRYKAEQAREEEKKQIQIEQRDVLRQLERGQTAQNGKLSTVMSENATRYQSATEIIKLQHEELLRTLNSSCKFVPTAVTVINKETK